MTPSTELTGVGIAGTVAVTVILAVGAVWGIDQIVRYCVERRQDRRRWDRTPPLVRPNGGTPRPCGRHVVNVRPMRRPYDWERQ